MLLRVWLQMSVYTIQVEAEFVVRTVVKNLDTVEIKTVSRIAFIHDCKLWIHVFERQCHVDA